eukprot:8154390-Karenia_brevis.AAC.1
MPVVESTAVFGDFWAHELKAHRAFRKKGYRHHHANAPAVRMPGPLTAEAVGFGVDFVHLLRCRPRCEDA